MGGLVEAEGIDVFTGFAASELLYDGRVVGVRTGDRGIGKHGEAEVHVRAGRGHPREGHDPDRRRPRQPDEGARPPAGARRGRSPQLYAIGLKELWEVPKDRVAPGTVIHSMGYPLRMEEFGGGFIYAMPDGVLSVGFVCGLDYKDPMFDPHVTSSTSSGTRWSRAARGRAARALRARRRCPRAAGTRSRASTPTACSSPATPAASSTRCASRAFTSRCAPACWPPRRPSRPCGPAMCRRRGCIATSRRSTPAR
jgi:hypothetical protein